MRFICEERAAFIYGSKMLEVFTMHHALENLSAYVLTGNYRLYDYRTHQTFYDQLAAEHIQRRLPQTRTFLFAPTWNDGEGKSAFDDVCEILLETLPPATNLIVKLHPNTFLQEPRKIDRLYDKYGSHPHILFLDRYPHIYSLLALCDLYIGDLSSIGYDFLHFNKPMVFLNQRQLDGGKDPSASLWSCGIVVPPADYPRLYSIIEDLLPHDNQLFSDIRKEVYMHTFGTDDLPKTLRSKTTAMLEKLSEKLEWQ